MKAIEREKMKGENEEQILENMFRSLLKTPKNKDLHRNETIKNELKKTK